MVLAEIKAAQEQKRNGYAQALSEICAGQKRTCWMWYIWPSLAKVRTTSKPQFSLPSIDAACDYLHDPLLAQRLTEITEAALAHLRAGVPPVRLFGGIDSRKFHEVATCFAVAALENGDLVQARLFMAAVQAMGGELEQKTMEYVIGEVMLTRYRGIHTSYELSAKVAQFQQDLEIADTDGASVNEVLQTPAQPLQPTPQTSATEHACEVGRALLAKSSQKSRPTLVVEPRRPAAGLVVIFHGAGGSAHCFKDLAEEWSQHLPHVKFVMPTAPIRGTMTAWMAKSKATGACYNYDAEWREALTFIEDERQFRGVPLSRVVIMGYSAGASMASWVALNLPKPCAGLILLSGLCPCPPRLPEPRLAPGMIQTPILYMCGSDDLQIPAKIVRSHAQSLLEKGFAVKFLEFPGVGHELVPEEIAEILRFLITSLPEGPPNPAEALEGCLADDLAGLDWKLGQVGNTTLSSQPTSHATSSRRCARQASGGRVQMSDVEAVSTPFCAGNRASSKSSSSGSRISDRRNHLSRSAAIASRAKCR